MVGQGQDKEESTASPPPTPSETSESGDKEYRLSDRPQASPDLSFLHCVSISLVGSLSLPLNPTSSFPKFSLVGRGVWVSDGIWSLLVVEVGVGIMVGWGAGQQCQIWLFFAAPRSDADLAVAAGGIWRRVGLWRWWVF